MSDRYFILLLCYTPSKARPGQAKSQVNPEGQKGKKRGKEKKGRKEGKSEICITEMICTRMYLTLLRMRFVSFIGFGFGRRFPVFVVWL
jgi:hypothetical protein